MWWLKIRTQSSVLVDSVTSGIRPEPVLGRVEPASRCITVTCCNKPRLFMRYLHHYEFLHWVATKRSSTMSAKHQITQSSCNIRYLPASLIKSDGGESQTFYAYCLKTLGTSWLFLLLASFFRLQATYLGFRGHTGILNPTLSLTLNMTIKTENSQKQFITFNTHTGG